MEVLATPRGVGVLQLVCSGVLNTCCSPLLSSQCLDLVQATIHNFGQALSCEIRLGGLRAIHSRSHSCDPLGQRHGSRALAIPELSNRGAGQEDHSSGNENACNSERNLDLPCGGTITLVPQRIPPSFTLNLVLFV